MILSKCFSHLVMDQTAMNDRKPAKNKISYIIFKPCEIQDQILVKKYFKKEMQMKTIKRKENIKEVRDKAIQYINKNDIDVINIDTVYKPKKYSEEIFDQKIYYIYEPCICVWYREQKV